MTTAQARIIDTLKAGGSIVLDIDTCGAHLYAANGRKVGSVKERTLFNCVNAGHIVPVDEHEKPAIDRLFDDSETDRDSIPTDYRLK